ncbi:MAG: hypothetical protein Q4G08_06895 [Capnocytophaga sp.]|nr:hypothetical protein [Capnocytophaga sp.]
MKKIGIIIGAALLMYACNDGDLEVESISFDNTDVLSCTSDTTATFLFKYTSQQALILTLPSGALTQQEGTITGEIPTEYGLYYRDFNATVSTAYFCSDYPPSSPSVIVEIAATGGTISIETKAIYDENTGTLLRYDHLITIADLVMVNSKGEKLVDSNFIFGTYQTR